LHLGQALRVLPATVIKAQVRSPAKRARQRVFA
jgi:hypothetical protein